MARLDDEFLDLFVRPLLASSTLSRAREILPQFRTPPGLYAIANAKLLVHEERPDEVAAAAFRFFDS